MNLEILYAVHLNYPEPVVIPDVSGARNLALSWRLGWFPRFEIMGAGHWGFDFMEGGLCRVMGCSNNRV